MQLRLAVLCLLGGVGALPTAAAVEATSVPAEAVEKRKLEPLRFESVSLHSENDKYFAGTDRNYTSGFKVSLLSQDLLHGFGEARLPGPMRVAAKQAADRVLSSEREARIAISLGQNLYTPTDTLRTDYIPDDRPYAAWLFVGAAFHNYRTAVETGSGARLDVFEINLGVVGPSALGRQIQDLIHDIIGAERSEGWDNQIHDEPGLNLIYERKWRFSSPEARTDWGIDLIPHAGVLLGNVFTYANAGVTIRAGFALPADFGPNLIRTSADAGSRRERFGFFAFLSADGRAVARDITLDGNTFRESPSVNRRPFVFDLMGGIGIGVEWAQLTHTQARRSLEFRGQEKAHDFGSIALSFFY